jgi:hypothetical protein
MKLFTSSQFIKWINLFVFVIAWIFFPSCQAGDDQKTAKEKTGSLEEIYGDGNHVTQVRDMKNEHITTIVLKGAIDLYLTQDKTTSVQVMADNNIVPYVLTTLKGSVLEIELSPDKLVRGGSSIQVHVSTPQLTHITCQGSGNVLGKGVFSFPDLTLEMQGSGNVDISDQGENLKVFSYGSGNLKLKGEVKKLELEASGSGNHKCCELKTHTAIVSLTGSGDIAVNVEEELDAKLRGSGNINYLGNPNVAHEVSGSGNLEAIEKCK